MIMSTGKTGTIRHAGKSGITSRDSYQNTAIAARISTNCDGKRILDIRLSPPHISDAPFAGAAADASFYVAIYPVQG